MPRSDSSGKKPRLPSDQQLLDPKVLKSLFAGTRSTQLLVDADIPVEHKPSKHEAWGDDAAISHAHRRLATKALVWSLANWPLVRVPGDGADPEFLMKRDKYLLFADIVSHLATGEVIDFRMENSQLGTDIIALIIAFAGGATDPEDLIGTSHPTWKNGKWIRPLLEPEWTTSCVAVCAEAIFGLGIKKATHMAVGYSLHNTSDLGQLVRTQIGVFRQSHEG